MSKLYVFGIGGTGSRVLKSLTMLLAAGIRSNVDTIVPIIIDPDDTAADLTRTVETMKKYTSIRNQLDFTSSNKNQFFRTEILESVQDFRFPLYNTRNLEFKDYMEVNKLSNSNNKALINMLFSQDNLNSDMKVGFRGNPNVGSVVLNQFSGSSQFKDFANSFQQGDRIFIISSIFGGTGASGFPLLLKTFRNGAALTRMNIPNWKLIVDAPIGAISVLPYFKVKQDNNSKIDSATFISKTKSALSYYERNISDNNSLDMFYYIADDVNNNPYDNNDGGANQKNDAHFVELVSALAIVDFISVSPNQNPNQNLQRLTIHKEYGMKNNNGRVILGDLGQKTQEIINRPLTQFLLFTKYLDKECEKEYSHQPWSVDRKFDKAFFGSLFYKEIKAIQEDFIIWLKEMDKNNRHFTPFEISKKKKVFEIVEGKESEKMACLSSNYALFDNVLNKQNCSKSSSKEQQFMELFYKATENLVNNKFNF